MTDMRKVEFYKQDGTKMPKEYRARIVTGGAKKGVYFYEVDKYGGMTPVDFNWARKFKKVDVTEKRAV